MEDGTEIVFLSTKGTEDDIDEPMRKFLDYVDGKPGAEEGDEYIRRLHQGVKNVRMNKEWKREYMDLQIMIKHREQEAARKAVEEAAPKIREEAASDERRRTIRRMVIRMVEDGSLSDEQIMAFTGASVQEVRECREKTGRK